MRIEAADKKIVDLDEVRRRIDNALATAKAARNCFIVSAKTLEPTEEMDRIYEDARNAQRELLSHAPHDLDVILSALMAVLSVPEKRQAPCHIQGLDGNEVAEIRASIASYNDAFQTVHQVAKVVKEPRDDCRDTC